MNKEGDMEIATNIPTIVYLGKGIVVFGDDSGSVSLSFDYGNNWEPRQFASTAWMNLSKNLGNELLSTEGEKLLQQILKEG